MKRETAKRLKNFAANTGTTEGKAKRGWLMTSAGAKAKLRSKWEKARNRLKGGIISEAMAELRKGGSTK